MKAAAGGGGRGIKLAADPAELEALFAGARRGAGGVRRRAPVRRALRRGARHVEVQVLGDGHGHVVHLGERDCSVQRRHQKILEEAPVAGARRAARASARRRAVARGAALGYETSARSSSWSTRTANDFFLEINCRIQVEHPVTEMVTGHRPRRATRSGSPPGEPLGSRRRTSSLARPRDRVPDQRRGPSHDFRPAPGPVERYRAPGGPGIRVDSACRGGRRGPAVYDSLIGKLIAHGEGSREEALGVLRGARRAGLEGVDTTAGLHDGSSLDHELRRRGGRPPAALRGLRCWWRNGYGGDRRHDDARRQPEPVERDRA